MKLASTLCALLIGPLLIASAAEPQTPAIVELSPTQRSKPVEPLTVSPDCYRWFGIQGYSGPLTWEVEGSAAGYQVLTAAGQLFGRAEGQTEPAFAAIPANALIVWGRAGAGGTVKLKALGIIEGSPKTLATQTIQIVGSNPKPTPSPGPSPSPTPTPIAAGPRYIVVVEQTPTGDAVPVNYLGDIAEQLKAKGHTLRTCNPDTVDAGGKVPSDLAPYIQRTRAKKLPFVFIVEDKQPQGRLLFEGDLPANASEFLKLLSEKGG